MCSAKSSRSDSGWLRWSLARALAAMVATAVLLVSSNLHADKVGSMVPGGKPVEVPKDLAPWVPWVLDGLSGELCTKLGDKPVCSWPGIVDLRIEEGGALFRLEVTLDAEGWVPLPGSAEHWPLEVKADGKNAVVLARGESPAVSLGRGKHSLSGRFRWVKAPETLPVPGSVAIVSLAVRGRAIQFPRREENGAVWLQAGSAADQDVPERVEIEVMRRLDDGVPLRVTTRLDLHISGKTRELRLSEPLVTGSRPVSATSPIPLRFEPSGELVLQARAGEHTVELVSVLAKPPSELKVPRRPPPWPAQETWVWSPATALRQVVLGGASGVDPGQTNLPSEWKKLQAFVLGTDRALTFQTVRRGEAEPPPNRLNLTRSLWLDLDGGGYTVRDQLSGSMSRDWRLDLRPWPLGRAVVNGADWLITDSAQRTGGVEVRQGSVDVKAEWRLRQPSRDLPAVGWSTDVNSLETQLHLPPGWELLGASGVDSASDTWASHWTLWGFFFVLVTAIAVARLLGWPWGALALLALVLSHDREGAPVATWVVLLGVTALLYLVPRGHFRTVLRASWITAALVLAVLVTLFVVGEVRQALFPTTQGPYRERVAAFGAVGGSALQSDEPAAMAVDADNKEGGTGTRAKGEEGSMARSSAAALGTLKVKRSDVAVVAQDPEAVIQTGPGVPRWRWRTVSLGWSGPVHQGQRIELWLLSPMWTGFLGCLRALLVALMAYALVRRAPYGPEPPPRARRGGKTHALLGRAVLALVLGWPSVVRAQTPSQPTLDELKTRLTRGPDCDPCVEVASLEFRVDGGNLRALADVHAGALTAYQLPGPARSWVPAAVRVDGQPTSALALHADGFLHVRLAPGRHQVEATGPIAGHDLTLTPGTKPRHASVSANGWVVDGVRDGKLEGSLHLSRTVEEAARQVGQDKDPASGARVALPPWLEIIRTFDIGVSWKIITQVNRVSPVGEPVSLRYPLLRGEEVTESGALVEAGALVVALDRDQTKASYRSIIKPRPNLEVLAPTDRPWTEEWRVRCNAIWHCAFQGLAPYRQLDDGNYAPFFRPWPGEKLSVSLTKPGAAPGESRTIDAVSLELTPGQRLMAGDLTLTARVSKGGAQTITLPPASVVQTLTINDTAEPIRMTAQRLELALRPGEQRVHVTWHQPGAIGTFFTVPTVSVGGEVVNATVRVVLPSDRWLLFTAGPSWGPKVLLWAYLLLVLAAATVLVRLPKNPLQLWQWWLLGLGLTQTPVPVALIIASWFFALALRGAWQPEKRWRKNLIQLLLSLYTVVFLGCLVGAVYDGLVNNPDMMVRGAASGATMQLDWYVDRAANVLPVATVISVPLWVWRGLNLLWALWLAVSLLGWLRWAWGMYSCNGLWYAKVPASPLTYPAAPPAAPEPVEPAPASSGAESEDRAMDVEEPPASDTSGKHEG